MATRTEALGYTATAEAEEIVRACDRLGLHLIDVVHQPQLADVLDRIDTGEASCLVVSGLGDLATEVSEFASVVDRLERHGARLIALDVGLDTADEPGHLAVTRRPRRPLPWATPEPEPEPAPPEPEATPPAEPAAAEPEAAEPEAAPPKEPLPAAEPAPIAEAAAPAEPLPAAEAAPPPEADAAAKAAPPPAEPLPAPAAAVAVRALGYASATAFGDVGAEDLEAQRVAIERSAAGLGCELVEVVADREPKDGKAFDRPGLSHALERIAAGDASCLVVAGLERVSRSVAELGTLVHWLEDNGIRLVAVDIDLDTASTAGRGTARALAAVAEMERGRISERTRKGLAAARAKRHEAGDQAATDWAALRHRIATMRADGMTLQAIANVLNEEGVPTQRGGAKWRPSSVQTAAGYKRRARAKGLGDLPRKPPSSG